CVAAAHTQFSQSRARERGLVRASYGMVRWLYPRADLVAAVSEGVRDDLSAIVGLPATRIAVLHNPVCSDARTYLAAAPIDHPWFREGGPPVILGVGRLVTQKN